MYRYERALKTVSSTSELVVRGFLMRSHHLLAAEDVGDTASRLARVKCDADKKPGKAGGNPPHLSGDCLFDDGVEESAVLHVDMALERALKKRSACRGKAGFVRQVPELVFFLGRWSGRALLPRIGDMIADTIDHLDQAKPLLANLNEGSWRWYKTETRVDFENTVVGPRLRPFESYGVPKEFFPGRSLRG